MYIEERIVAEVSRTYDKRRHEERPPIAIEFERVIDANKVRGYRLESWQMTSVPIQTRDEVGAIAREETVGVIETIVAVFVKVE